jgi:hypothetical protein
VKKFSIAPRYGDSFSRRAEQLDRSFMEQFIPSYRQPPTGISRLDCIQGLGIKGGVGLGGNPPGSSASWNSAHENQSCADTAPRGGAGRFHCFAAK